jgi:hypothetical protein
MKKQMLSASCVLMLMTSPAMAQSGTGTGSGTSSSASSSTTVTQKDGKTTTTTIKAEESQNNPRFVRTLTNVQVELNLTDQVGSQAPEKKTVSMIVSSGNWGKIRSLAQVMQIGEPPYQAILNVDARPFVSIDGPVQLELTLVYEPVKAEGEARRPRSSGINQSQTVVLASGKPLIVSQAADPVSDRKVVVEVKATVLK